MTPNAATQRGRMVWIIGAGRFGRRSVEVLAARKRPPQLVVVDQDPQALAQVRPTGLETVRADGVEFLLSRLEESPRPDWIVPCVPFHLAFEFVTACLKGLVRVKPVPDRIRDRLPNPWPADQGGYYVSFADFICPPDCPEPAGICTHTGRPRRGNLFADLPGLIRPDARPAVIRSRQLAPGLGGLTPADLSQMEKTIAAAKPGQLVAAATACRCHGVVHAAEKIGEVGEHFKKRFPQTPSQIFCKGRAMVWELPQAASRRHRPPGFETSERGQRNISTAGRCPLPVHRQL